LGQPPGSRTTARKGDRCPRKGGVTASGGPPPFALRDGFRSPAHEKTPRTSGALSLVDGVVGTAQNGGLSASCWLPAPPCPPPIMPWSDCPRATPVLMT